MIGLVALIALGLIGYFAFWRIGPPLIGRITPSPVHVGQTVVIEGQGFDPALEDNIVLFDDYAGRMVKGGRTQIEVEVPDSEGEFGFMYTVENEHLGTASSFLTVNASSRDTGSPRPGARASTFST